MLLTECELQAGLISPKRRIQTVFRRRHCRLLVLQKGSPTRSVWFYDITADGFSLDDRRAPIEANDIPDLLAKWPGREEGPNSYRVPIEKIQANGWSLAAGRYRSVGTEAVTHDSPTEVLSNVLKLENEIVKRAGALLAQLAAKK